jgi:radical SAM protein with 4Fe4S-binding SPASM domain
MTKMNSTISKRPKMDGFDFWPQYLLLELTTKCNLRCIMCAINQDPRIQKGGEWYGDLDTNAFKNIEPYLPKIERVDLNGHGESLMYSNFLPILEKVKQGGSYVGLTSNALLINDHLARMMVKTKLDEIIISLHAAESDLYEQISRRGKLNKVLSNIRAINKYKNYYQTGLPILKFQFVAMKRNISQLEKVINLARDMGVVEVAVLVLVEYDLVQGESLANYPELIKEYFPPAIECAKNLGVQLTIPPLYLGMLPKNNKLINKEHGIKDSKISLWKFLRNRATSLHKFFLQDSSGGNEVKARYCFDPWNFCWVMQSGRVRPCCFMEEDMGSLVDQSFEEIWFGEKYELFRRQILENKPPEKCKECIQRPMAPLSELKSLVDAKRGQKGQK